MDQGFENADAIEQLRESLEHAFSFEEAAEELLHKEDACGL